MVISIEFLSLILDSIAENITVINEMGEIQYVNKSWTKFGENNECVVGGNWCGVNYLDICDKASVMGDEFGGQAGKGIRTVIEGQKKEFYFEYPCHGPNEKRWFMMHVSSFSISEGNYFIICHQNITERKLAEEEARILAELDGLTNIPNRRAFNEFLYDEWRRCFRLKKTITLAIVDLDHFKLLNDSYGHQSGDECLVKVGKLLREFAKRPGDICARYGGEEFALVWSDTDLNNARSQAGRLLKNIENLNIPNKNSPVESYLTASIGIAEMLPDKDTDLTELISKADNMLYRAKGSGKNRVFG